MRAFFIVTVLTFFLLSCKKETINTELIETEPPVLEANFIKVNYLSSGFYSAIPARYNQNNKKYPLLIWIHGNGQVGNGSTDLHSLLFGGIPKLLNEKRFPPNFKVNGNNFSFIIIAPQFTWWPGNEEVLSYITYAKKNYRIDTSRIYLSGLSMGGIVTADFGAEYPSRVAAIIPISGVSTDSINNKCANIANGKLPEWIFQNTNDEVFDINTTRKYVSLLKSFKSAISPKYTEFLPYGENGHDAWTMATDPNYKENNMNIYEWMLQYKR